MHANWSKILFPLIENLDLVLFHFSYIKVNNWATVLPSSSRMQYEWNDPCVGGSSCCDHMASFSEEKINGWFSSFVSYYLLYLLWTDFLWTLGRVGAWRQLWTKSYLGEAIIPDLCIYFYSLKRDCVASHLGALHVNDHKVLKGVEMMKKRK